jgi:hypothetical protein
MKLYFLALFFLVASAKNVSAQDLFLISGGGTHSSGSGGSVSWSIGEVVIQTATSSGNHVTQGFHQGNIYVVGIEELVEIAVSVYPNPTSESVTIQISEPVNVSIYDMSGRLVGTHTLADAINSIDVTSFSRGTYNMIFERKGSETRNVKLIVL